MSNERNFKIDLNLIENDPVHLSTDYGLAPAAAYNMPMMPSDSTPQGYVLQSATPPFAMVPGIPDMSPAFVDASQLVYATPTFSTTPSYFAPSPGFMTTQNGMMTPDYSNTPGFLSMPLADNMGIPMADTPAYGVSSYNPNYRHRRNPHIAVSCRVHNVVKRVRGFCLKNNIPLIKVVDGPNVLKISVRSVLHTQKVEKALTNIVRIDGIKVESISLPEAIDVTKRKRGFLLFMNLDDFEKDQAQVLKRFAETGLDYKITIVDGLTHSKGAKPKPNIEALQRQVELLSLQLQKLTDSQSPKHKEDSDEKSAE